MADALKFFASVRFLLLILAVLPVINTSHSTKRQIHIEHYKCPDDICKEESISIIYVNATDIEEHNIVHFIWSVYETPSIIVAYSSNGKSANDAGIKINWKKLISAKPENAIQFRYDYISAFEISELDEISDPKDNVLFTTSDFISAVKHATSLIEWGDPYVSSNEVTFNGAFLGGNVTFQCESAQEDGRDVDPPKPLYTSNGTRFSILFQNLKLNTTDHSRIALKLLTHTEEDQSTCVVEDQSIDDEYSPGVFRTFVINNTFNGSLSSSISWKPVSYNNDPKGLQTQVPSYQYIYNNDKEFSHTKVRTDCSQKLISSSQKPSKIIQAVMKVKNTRTHPMMVSFGQNKDGWYQGTNHLDWSGQVSFGRPQFDKLSTTVLVTIIVGLGLPFLAILAGSLYVCIKKYRERMTTSTYGKIN